MSPVCPSPSSLAPGGLERRSRRCSALDPNAPAPETEGFSPHSTEYKQRYHALNEMKLLSAMHHLGRSDTRHALTDLDWDYPARKKPSNLNSLRGVFYLMHINGHLSACLANLRGFGSSALHPRLTAMLVLRGSGTHIPSSALNGTPSSSWHCRCLSFSQ